MYTSAEKNLAKQSITKHVSQIEKLNRSLAEKDAELSQLQATLNKGTASVREAYDADRVMYEEKIASLTKALKGINVHVCMCNTCMYYACEWHVSVLYCLSSLHYSCTPYADWMCMYIYSVLHIYCIS